MTAPILPTPEGRLAAAGHALPPAPVPRGTYAPFCVAAQGTLSQVTVSGQTCRRNGVAMAGLCRSADDVDAAREATQVAMLNALAALRAACAGELAAVVQVTRLRGFVRSAPEFAQHTAVLDAASALLRQAFPGQPLPARSALGVSSLPDQAWVEIEVDAVIRSPAQIG